jgi:hypothetical protein
MMEKETHELLRAAKVAARNMRIYAQLPETARHLESAIRKFEAAQAKHPEHVMFLKADDGARTR